MGDPDFNRVDHQLSAAASGRLRVFGIRRTGQHAIINWVLRNNGQDNYVFLNSCTMGKSPIRTCGQSEIDGKPARKAHYLKRTLEPMLAEGTKPFVLISYEAGFPPERHATGDLTNGFSNKDFDAELLITRSFVNWLPSFIRLMRAMMPAAEPEALAISAGVIFEISRYKDHLLAAQASNHCVVSYDSWFSQPAYRCKLLAKLGLPVVDNSLGSVQTYGGGSSFSKFTVAAPALEVKTRWRSMADDPFAKHFLRLVLADSGFMAALAHSYPEDVDIISHLLN